MVYCVHIQAGSVWQDWVHSKDFLEAYNLSDHLLSEIQEAMPAYLY